MASRKTDSKTRSEDDDDPNIRIINYYFFNGCTSFQIGSNNEQVFNSGARILEQRTEGTTSQGLTREQTIVVMLKSILSGERFSLQKLETCFLDRYKKTKKRSFKDVSGLNLLPFLQKMPNEFNLILKKSNWFVDVVKHSSVTSPLPPSSKTLCEKSSKKHSTAPTNVIGTAEAARMPEEDSSGSSSDSNGWTVVNRKRKTSKQVVQITKHETKKTSRGENQIYGATVANTTSKTPTTSIRKSIPEAAKYSHASLPTRSKPNIPASPFNDPGPKATAEQLQQDFISFMQEVDYFKKGHFALLTGRIAERALSKSVEILTTVPWVIVFDLDEESRDSGLLARVEDALKVTRYLNICTWMDPVKISEKATAWHFLRGNRAIPGSRFEEGYRGWWKQVNPILSVVVEDIARFVEDTTVLKVIVIWDDLNAAYINSLVCKLDEVVQPNVKFIVCVDQMSNTNTDVDFAHLKKHVDENMKVIPISCWNLFVGICDHLQKTVVSRKKVTSCTIPNANAEDNNISGHEYAWLMEYIVIVEMDKDRSDTCDLDIIQEDAQTFFKGGPLKWETRSICGTDYLDIERDAMERITDAIKQFILTFKSGLYTLYHAPGSGGSTLAQRVLWELRDMSPCIEIHFHSGASLSDIVHRLDYLHEHTHLPILALIDGEDDHNVRQLMRSLHHICLVVLNVKRYAYSMDEKRNTPNTYWLQGHLTHREARKLALKFGTFCKDEQKEKKEKALKDLSKDVKRGVQHHLYEFGLAAYLHEFTGIQSYVRGYLRVHDNQSDFLPWQIILGYFSLVYYYGQTSIPSQFFCQLLGKQSNYAVTLEDFPYEVKQFIVTDNSNGKSNELRICHYIIAKEILEQLLTRGTCTKKGTTASLSDKACRHLETFAIAFINDASKKKVKAAVTSSAVAFIITRTFIARDIEEVEGETQSRKRPAMAKLLTDITSKPPYTERLRVLKKLTEAFPNDPNLHAHLGRFYSLCRPNEEDSAMQSFETALTLCKKQMNAGSPDARERLKMTLTHIYHMYGTIYSKQLQSRIYDAGARPHTQDTFEEMAKDLLDLAELACDNFKSCREAKNPGYEDSFGFVGEIKVRLRMCDFIHRRSNYSNLVDYISEEGHSEIGSQLSAFVEKSITEIDDLIMECQSVVDPDYIDSSFTNAVTWHHTLLGKFGSDLEALGSPYVTENIRFKIAAKKLTYSAKGRHATLDNIKTAAGIKEVVEMYIDIFEEAGDRGVEDKRALGIDFSQWMEAIRHNCYDVTHTVEDVLVQVRRWHFLLSTSMSVFYLFVLTSMIGFGSSMGNGNPESLNEAQNLKDQLKKYGRWANRFRYPIEWLGECKNGIKQLMSSKAFVVNSDGKVKTLSNGARSSKALMVCKGTIRKPNTSKVSGFIELDLGNNYIPVHVFFIPLRTDFEGPIHAGTRVEFHLGFSFFNAYEAFSVQALNKYECASCGSSVEILSCESSKVCNSPKCKMTVYRADTF